MLVGDIGVISLTLTRVICVLLVVAVEFSRLFCWTEGASKDVKIYNSEFLHC